MRQISFMLIFFCLAMPAAAEEPKRVEDPKLIKVKRVKFANILVLENDETVRLIGVGVRDAFGAKGKERFWGRKALDFVRYACQGKNVYMEYDEAFKKTDHKNDEGYTLAYVHLENGRSLNEWILEEGYGLVPKKLKFSRREAYQKIYDRAVQSKQGEWGAAKGGLQ